MQVKMIRMREKGVEPPRRLRQDRYTVKHWGMLTISDQPEPALRRVVKVARLALDTGDRTLELVEPRLAWVSGQNFALVGVERRDVDGETVHYAQGWLCTVELADVAEQGQKSVRETRRNARQ